VSGGAKRQRYKRKITKKPYSRKKEKTDAHNLKSGKVGASSLQQGYGLKLRRGERTKTPLGASAGGMPCESGGDQEQGQAKNLHKKKMGLSATKRLTGRRAQHVLEIPRKKTPEKPKSRVNRPVEIPKQRRILGAFSQEEKGSRPGVGGRVQPA